MPAPIQTFNEDCLKILGRFEAMADLVILDPPWFRITKESWDREFKTETQYFQWLKCIFVLAENCLKETGSLYLWFGIGKKNHTLLPKICDYLNSALIFQDWITWAKSRGMGNRRGWMYCREELLWYSKSENYFWNVSGQYDLSNPTNRNDLGHNGKPRKSQFKRYSNVWINNEDQLRGERKVDFHYTPKPLELTRRIIKAHTADSDSLVIDPFLGSGTTAVVCRDLGVRCIGIEKDPEIYRRSIDRIYAPADVSACKQKPDTKPTKPPDQTDGPNLSLFD